MSRERLEIGFVPLVDAVTLVVAHEMGFAAEEGLALVLRREPSWSNIRDKVGLGLYPAAHMLAPLPLAMSLGVGAMQAAVIAPAMLSAGGAVIGAAPAVAQALAAAPDGPPAWGDARAAGRAVLRLAETRPLVVATPFPQSMHTELLRYWLEGCGGDPDHDVSMQTVPPPLMGAALEAGQVDLFCVGEPWGSLAVERGVAALLLPSTAIWAYPPEKALGVREDWARENPRTMAALLRALHRAGRWLSRAQAPASAAEMLAKPDYLGVSSLVIERALTGALVVDGAGSVRQTRRFLDLGGPEATFPWRSHAQWIAHRCALRWGVDPAEATAAAQACYRPDLYRAALAPLGVDLPGASSKVEGALAARTGVASSRGSLFLGPDSFFDGRVFDPAPKKQAPAS